MTELEQLRAKLATARGALESLIEAVEDALQDLDYCANVDGEDCSELHTLSLDILTAARRALRDSDGAKPFNESVSQLVKKRQAIPKEVRAMSGVPRALRGSGE